MILDRRAVRPLLKRLFVLEQGPDHRTRRGVHQNVGEPARLDLQRRVEWDKRPFIGRRQKRLGRRIDAHRPTMHHCGRSNIGHEPGWVIGRAAWHLVTLLIPGLHDVRVTGRQNPGLRPLQKLCCRNNLIHQPRGLGAIGAIGFPLQKMRAGRHRTHLADQPRCAPGARKDPDQDFGQANPRLRRIGCKNPVTTQRNLIPDPQCSAGQSSRNGLAPLQGLWIHTGPFDLSHDPMHPHDAFEDPARRVIARHLFHPGNDVQIHAPGKAVLPGGQHHAFNGIVAQRPVNQRVQLVPPVERHHVHRLLGYIPGDRRNAVVFQRIVEFSHDRLRQ